MSARPESNISFLEEYRKKRGEKPINSPAKISPNGLSLSLLGPHLRTKHAFPPAVGCHEHFENKTPLSYEADNNESKVVYLFPPDWQI